jgi:predicted Zn-dependent peptidase
VQALPIDALRDLHSRAYAPEHVVLSAAGHVEHEALVSALEAAGWAELSRKGTARVVPPSGEVATVGGFKHVVQDLAQSQIVIGGTAMAYADPRRYAASLLSTVLGGGMSSRLFQRIREERGLVYSIYSFLQHYSTTGVHGVYLATAPEQVESALAAVREELRDVARRGLSPEELSNGKGQLKGQMTLSLESPGSRLYRAAATELYGEPFRPLDAALALIDAISADDVATVASEFWDPDRLTTVVLGPGAS